MVERNKAASIEEVRLFWDEHICGDIFTSMTERYSPAYLAEVRSRRYHYAYHLLPFLHRVAQAADGGRVLEIGCSMGMDLAELIERGCQCTGLDLSPESVRVAKYHLALRGLEATLTSGNAECLCFPDESFDVVYSFGVLHHTPDIERALAEVARVLRPGGRLFLMLYSRYSLNNLVHVLFRIPYESPRDWGIDAPVTRTFSQQELSQLLTPFEAVQIEKRYLFGAGWRPLSDIMPQSLNDALGRLAGWHWLIEARKPA